ncbi:MAG TPA: gluconate 2-dehydrogenase subunit 3 family protein [Burkholderiales bacterium]|nr:gluconate 2-dehydrogenase subunit 3 family protein [Burkholderiales bacterium]
MNRDRPRREFLKGLGTLGAAAALPAAAARTGERPGDGHDHSAPVSVASIESTTLLFLTRAEADFVDAALSCFIPSDDLGPGAREAGVTFFIDRQLHGAWGAMARGYRLGPWPEGTPQQGYQSPLTPREVYRTAIREIDALCETKYRKRFADLPQPQQEALLKTLDAGELTLESVSGTLFMNLLWTNTQEGFFADPVYGGNHDKAGWRLVGFPGVAAAYTDHVERHGQPYDVEPVGIDDMLGRAVELDEHGHPVHRKLARSR